MPDRCEDGRLMRHRPFPDDPHFEHDVGECPECQGAGCELLSRGRERALRLIDIIPHLDALGRGKASVHHIYPPIPVRDFDWCATFDNDEPNDSGSMMVGYGKTQVDALSDLLDQAEAAQ